MTMVSAVGFEPTTPGFIPLRLSPPVNKLWPFVVWTVPSPSAWPVRCCPSSLYTFPSKGLARDWQWLWKVISVPRLWADPLQKFPSEAPNFNVSGILCSILLSYADFIAVEALNNI